MTSSRGTPMMVAAACTSRWSSRPARSRRWYSSTISATGIPCSGLGLVRPRTGEPRVSSTESAWQLQIRAGIGGIPEPFPDSATDRVRPVGATLVGDHRGEHGAGADAELVVDPTQVGFDGL